MKSSLQIAFVMMASLALGGCDSRKPETKKVVQPPSPSATPALREETKKLEGAAAIAGAAGGAALGGLLGGGRGRNIAAGAILGAGTGALVGHLVGQADARGYYEGRRLPYGRPAGPGVAESPYRPYNLIDVRG